jgi:hypothetical protein
MNYDNSEFKPEVLTARHLEIANIRKSLHDFLQYSTVLESRALGAA